LNPKAEDMMLSRKSNPAESVFGIREGNRQKPLTVVGFSSFVITRASTYCFLPSSGRSADLCELPESTRRPDSNGLYWQSPQGAPRSPLGPLVAFASNEATTITPDKAQPYYGYYFRRLESQGPDARGGAKPYVVDGKMTGGFAYLAYPAKYGDTGIMSFIINQDGVVFEKNLGKDTVYVAKTLDGFNPDKTWTKLN
jgi:Protein of unknown function (DUF2950)